MGVLAGADPVRVGMVAYMLSRPRPVPLLVPFAAVGVTVNVAVGTVVLFVLGRVDNRADPALPGEFEIAIGVVALLIAVILMARRATPVRTTVPQGPDRAQASAIERLPGFARLPHRFRTGLRSDAAWLGWFLGICMGFPTPYYLAALAAVLSSGATTPVKAAALIVFNVLGFAAALLPVVSFSVAPAATRRRVSQVYDWMGAHRRAVLSTLAVVVGLYFVIAGVRHL
ncbi:GAP family protein [Mycobacterium sp. NPDC050551]|uniref:GAP family protein n=1 Tax=Mycobacterium sp. NPDC050551 TaxID=3155407 RepID=UPI003439AFFA